jgi:peptidoglycan/LPS O-acetylase OafA/YrhL
VQVFFAISAFLLFRPYLLALATGEPRPRTGDFFRRRALRILPGYWFALTVAALVFGATIVPGALGEHWWREYGLIQVYWQDQQFFGIPTAWSLCVEITFYLALPVFAALTWRLARRRSWRRAALLAITPLFVLGPFVRLLNTIHFGAPYDQIVARITYTLPGQANYFAAGMLLALFSVELQLGRALPARVQRFVGSPGNAWSLALLFYVLAAIVGGLASPLAPPLVGPLDFRTRFVLNDLLALGFVLAILMPAIFGTRAGDVPGRVLRFRPLLFVGVISYGVYLWHAPIGTWLMGHTALGDTEHWPVAAGWAVRTAAVLLAGVVAGTLSYRFVELPFLRLKLPRGRNRPQRAGAPHTAGLAGAPQASR